MPTVRPALDGAAPIAPRADSAASKPSLGEERPAFSTTLDAMHARADRFRSSTPHHGNARPATTREDDDDTRADAATRYDDDTGARGAAASGAEAAVAMHAETAPSNGAGADSCASDVTPEAALFDVTASATPTTTATSAAAAIAHAASADTTAAPATPPAPAVTEATIATAHTAVLATRTALRDQSGAARATSIDGGATPAAVADGDAGTDSARAEAAPDDRQREPGGTSAANAADDADGAAASRAPGAAAPSDPTASASPADAAEEATNAQQSYGSKAERRDEVAPRDSATQRAAAAAAPSDLTASASPVDAAEEATNAQQSHGSEAERRDEVAPGDSATLRAAASEGKAQAAHNLPADASASTADTTPPDERIQRTRGETTDADTPAPAARDAAGTSSATALRASAERSADTRYTIAAAHDRHQHGRDGTDAAHGVAQGSAGDGAEHQGGRSADGSANHDAANGTSTRADARERAGRIGDVPTPADAATSLARGTGADGAAVQERSTTDPTAAAGDASSRGAATAANGRDATPALAVRADGTPAPARGGASAASPWAERVVESVRIATLRGGGEMRLRLEPAGLGHIDVRITLAHDGIHAAIVAEHDSTRALLSNEQHLLHAALERSDMRLAGFSVDLGFGASSNAFGDAKRGAAGAGHVATAAPEADSVTIDHVAAAPSAPGHLSVRV